MRGENVIFLRGNVIKWIFLRYCRYEKTRTPRPVPSRIETVGYRPALHRRRADDGGQPADSAIYARALHHPPRRRGVLPRGGLRHLRPDAPLPRGVPLRAGAARQPDGAAPLRRSATQGHLHRPLPARHRRPSPQ